MPTGSTSDSPPRRVLTVNAGSSSIKAALFAAGAEGPVRMARAEVTGIRKLASMAVEDHEGRSDIVPLPGVRDHCGALGAMVDWVSAITEHGRLAAVGHRIVHGGDRHVGPVVADGPVVEDLQRVCSLAPIHQPVALEAVRVVMELVPEVPQVLAFDTAFHAMLSAPAQTFALPRELTASGVRRFGFHGLSYESIVGRLPAHLGEHAEDRVVVAHLGSGASLCALHGRRSVATTMGLTPLDGLPMATRCGALDPGVVLYLLRERGMTVDEVEDLLYHRSGLFGVSGTSGRMEFLLKAGTAAAEEAIELFVYRVATEVAAMASALGGLDAVVFTAGIGEHSAAIRAAILARCRWMGVELDDFANEAGGPRLSTPGSPVSAWVIPTDEEAVIATHALKLTAALHTTNAAARRIPK
jgi:acetate kinase